MGKADERVQESPIDGGEASPPVTATKVEWTSQEEKRLVMKMDLIVMPLLMVVFFALQLDRANIGNTLTDNFLEDVGITQFQFNVGQQLLSIGIFLFEIPSNLVLYRVGPRLWMGGQVFAWGFVATFQAFQHGVPAFMITRLLLGVCEAGFIPAGLYCITMWYKPAETSKRFSIFFIGNMAAQALGGVLAYGVLRMRGISSLTGWQWLFLLEGLYTFLAGALFVIFFPDSPNDPVTYSRLQYFTSHEREMLRARLLDDPSKLKQKSHITMAELKSALTNWRVYPHILATLCGMANVTTLNHYAPSVVRGFGYEPLRSNALSSVGGWVVLCICVIGGYVADYINKRGVVVLALLFGFWAFSLGSFLVASDYSKGKRYALLTLAVSFSISWHPINGSWIALNSKSAGERSIRMAMFIMAANAAGIIGGQTFQAKDKPEYHTGWSIIVALNTLAVLSIIFANIQYRVLNKRIERSGALQEQGSEEIVPGDDNGVGVTKKYSL